MFSLCKKKINKIKLRNLKFFSFFFRNFLKFKFFFFFFLNFLKFLFLFLLLNNFFSSFKKEIFNFFSSFKMKKKFFKLFFLLLK